MKKGRWTENKLKKRLERGGKRREGGEGEGETERMRSGSRAISKRLERGGGKGKEEMIYRRRHSQGEKIRSQITHMSCSESVVTR